MSRVTRRDEKTNRLITQQDRKTMKSILGCVTLSLFAMVATGMVAPPVAEAQETPDAPTVDMDMSQIKDYGRPGYPRVTVYLWGNAENGIWRVEKGTDLLEYLSVAARGTFRHDSDTRVRNVLKIYREGQVNEDPVFESTVDEIFARQSAYPELQNRDVIVVESIERRRLLSFRSISWITGSAASVASLVFLISNN